VGQSVCQHEGDERNDVGGVLDGGRREEEQQQDEADERSPVSLVEAREHAVDKGQIIAHEEPDAAFTEDGHRRIGEACIGAVLPSPGGVLQTGLYIAKAGTEPDVVPPAFVAVAEVFGTGAARTGGQFVGDEREADCGERQTEDSDQDQLLFRLLRGSFVFAAGADDECRIEVDDDEHHHEEVAGDAERGQDSAAEPEHPEPAELRMVVVDHQVEHECRAQVQAEHGRFREDADVPVEPHAVDEEVVLPVEIDAVEAPDAPVSAPLDAERAGGREPLQNGAGQPHEDRDERDDEDDIDVVLEQLFDGAPHHVPVEVDEQQQQQDDEFREQTLEVSAGDKRIDDDVRGPDACDRE